MYLSINSIHKLDNLVKDFEVAYRSFIINTIKKRCPSQILFEDFINKLLLDIERYPSMNNNKFKAKLNKLLNSIDENYRIIESCNQSITTKLIPETSKVPYVGALLDYVTIFFESDFKTSPLLKGFQESDFFKFSYDFHRVRNNLSHPASSRITSETAKELIQFVEKILLNLDDVFFWYSSKDKLKITINTFLNSITGPSIRINNINEIAYTHKKLIQRETELTLLKDLIFGKKGLEFYRKARSVVIYGYGGLGKTALVLEFINEVVKDCVDSNNAKELDFLLYFTAKEEELTFSDNNKQFLINEIKKQITSYENFVEYFYKYLNISTTSELSSLKGILIIDNLETLKEDKEKIIDFIKILPEKIQVIITSREEEAADSKIALGGYENISSGVNFIKEYIEEYNLRIEFSNEYEKIIYACKGNTLILILSLIRLNEDPSSFVNILNELNSTSSSSISTVANFMYKNTFDQAIKDIEKRGVNSKILLSVIAYYNEPIDLYSLAKLSNIDSLTIVESVCDLLLQKLVLTKKNEAYEINEFASKFIIVKIIPNKIEAQILTNRISEFKFTRRKILRNLEENRTNDKLNNIMQDWMPRNNIEKIAIAEAYNLFAIARSHSPTGIKKEKSIYIKDKFAEIESYSQHPYVKFQKARIFNLLLKEHFNKDYLEIITKSYEDVIFSIKFDYQYIAKTQSFAIVLWLYALFLKNEFEEFTIAARNLEEAKDVCESLGINNDNYNKIINDLSSCYQKLYNKTKDRTFLVMRDSIK